MEPKDRHNLTILQGKNRQRTLLTRQMLDDLIADLPMQIELQASISKITRAKYLNLIQEGFTKEEAIALCK